MDGLLFARLQFGLTTLYHFFFVPVSISLALYLAIMQTAWYRTGKSKYLKMVKFWSLRSAARAAARLGGPTTQRDGHARGDGGLDMQSWESEHCWADPGRPEQTL